MDSRSGFTLIEIVVVLVLMSIMAGAIAPLAVGQIRGERVRATQKRMERTIDAMVGDSTRGGYGYLGDLGQLPPLLEDLNSRGAQPAYSIDANDGIGIGYNGPYISQAGPADAALVDAWGMPFDYRSTQAQLTSPGPDRQLGTADDLVFPQTPPVVTGNVSVSVTGIPNDGGTACVLGEDDVDVFAGFSNSGIRQEIQLDGPVGSGGPFVSAAVHVGFHGLRLEGEGAFSGALARDVIEMRGGNAQLRVALIQPSGPAPACGG